MRPAIAAMRRDVKARRAIDARAAIIARAESLKAEVEQVFRDAEHWNGSVRKPGEAEIDLAGSVLISNCLIALFAGAYFALGLGLHEAKVCKATLVENVLISNATPAVQVDAATIFARVEQDSWRIDDVMPPVRRYDSKSLGLGKTLVVIRWIFQQLRGITNANVIGWGIAGVFNPQFELVHYHVVDEPTVILDIGCNVSSIGIYGCSLCDIDAALSNLDLASGFFKAITHQSHLLSGFSKAVLHCLPLPAIDISLNDDHVEEQNAKRVGGKELSMLSHIGQDDGDEPNNQNADNANRDYCPYCSWRGALIILGAVTGIATGLVVLLHGLNLYFGVKFKSKR
jgi:hypothetical protein